MTLVTSMVGSIWITDGKIEDVAENVRTSEKSTVGTVPNSDPISVTFDGPWPFDVNVGVRHTDKSVSTEVSAKIGGGSVSMSVTAGPLTVTPDKTPLKTASSDTNAKIHHVAFTPSSKWAQRNEAAWSASMWKSLVQR